ncbi:MAG: hypothetical protein P4M09_26400 [Devosia sp.]|nr:hypothetical protein [Devosia sp.]
MCPANWRVTNFSIIERAAIVLDRQKVMARLGPNDIFALVYTVSFTNPDGTTVEGFRPSYAAATMEMDDPEGWVLAHLPGGMEFCLPRNKWDEGEHYIVDLVSDPLSLFSIEAVTSGPRPRG